MSRDGAPVPTLLGSKGGGGVLPLITDQMDRSNDRSTRSFIKYRFLVDQDKIQQEMSLKRT